MNNFVRHKVLPLTTALIWGVSFVVQSVCAQTLKAFTFNAIRGLFAALALLVLCISLKKIAEKKNKKFIIGDKKIFIIGSICCGVALTFASCLQQAGLEHTSPGKAAFITSLYIVLVPVIGIFVGKKTDKRTWLSVLLAVIGLYLISVNEGFSIDTSDLYVIGCAVAFAVHILCIDRFSNRVNGVALSCGQFFVVTIISAILMVFFEPEGLGKSVDIIPELIYMGVISGGLGYTLQIVSQKGANPAILSLLLSLESVFGALTDAVYFGNIPTFKEGLGCFIMLAAVTITILPRKRKFKIG